MPARLAEARFVPPELKPDNMTIVAEALGTKLKRQQVPLSADPKLDLGSISEPLMASGWMRNAMIWLEAFSRAGPQVGAWCRPRVVVSFPLFVIPEFLRSSNIRDPELWECLYRSRSSLYASLGRDNSDCVILPA